MDETAVDHDPAPTRPTASEMLEAIPLGVELAEGVDVDSEDPAWSDDVGRRVCVATRKAGGRCTSAPLREGLCCAVHAGRADPALGGRARAEKIRKAREGAEERVAAARLGVRAAAALALQERAAEVHAGVSALCRRFASGDVEAARLLVPWVNQAHGMPTERLEHSLPSTPEELRGMATADLAELVAQGRRQRLHAVGE